MALRALAAPTPLESPREQHVQTMRVELSDGAATTVYAAHYPVAEFTLSATRLPRPAPLAAFCQERGIDDAIVGGFYVRPQGTPLGELRTRGVARRFVPFDGPWDGRRACVHIVGTEVRIARRDALPAQPVGDLLQAGPLLVRDGAVVSGDDEGFSAGARQFDSDITAGRYPRAALGAGEGGLIAVACDGRAPQDAGLTIAELAELMLALGAGEALNLDGGGSTSLVAGGQLRNRPRESHGIDIAGGRAVSTALVFTPRGGSAVTSG